MPQEEGEMYVRLAQEALHLSPNPPLNWVFGFVRRIVAVVATLARTYYRTRFFFESASNVWGGSGMGYYWAWLWS